MAKCWASGHRAAISIGVTTFETFNAPSIASSAVEGGVETKPMFDRGLVHLVGLGVDELSMTPPLLPSVKYLIRAMKFTDARKLAEQVANSSE